MQPRFVSDLEDLTEEEYQGLLETGMMWELFPHATGSWEVDCDGGAGECEY